MRTDEVLVRKLSEVNARGGGQTLPLHETWVHLDELELAVPRIKLELDVRRAVALRFPQKSDGKPSDFWKRKSFADPDRADLGGNLTQLAACDDAERLSTTCQVRAREIEVVVRAGNPLLDDR